MNHTLYMVEVLIVLDPFISLRVYLDRAKNLMRLLYEAPLKFNRHHTSAESTCCDISAP